MAENIHWGRIRYSYITGNMTQRDLAKKYGVSESRLSSVAKKQEWFQKRKEYRGKVGAAALSRACARDTDELVGKLDNLKKAADALGEQLNRIAEDPEQLFRHAAVVRTYKGNEKIDERLLKAANPVMMRALASSLKDVSAVLRNLYDLPTAQERAAQELAEEKLALERERLELEREKAGAELGDRALEAVIDDVTREAAE